MAAIPGFVKNNQPARARGARVGKLVLAPARVSFPNGHFPENNSVHRSQIRNDILMEKFGMGLN